MKLFDDNADRLTQEVLTPHDVDQTWLDSVTSHAATGVLDMQQLAQFRDELEAAAAMMLSSQLRQKFDPGDLVQETLSAAAEHWADFRGASAFELRAWLKQILSSRVSSMVRRFRFAAARDVSREQTLDRPISDSGPTLADRIVSDWSTPSSPTQRIELTRAINAALQQLPDDYRLVLTLHSLQELDWPEVATRMKRTVGSVRMLWARALQKLRPHLEGHQ